MIDNGLPLSAFEDALESSGELIDYVKFGWGTSLVTSDLPRKIAAARRANAECFFGGTLFEKAVYQDRLEGYLDFCREHGVMVIEVSNGTIDLSNQAKARHIAELKSEFTIFSEVGYKDTERSLKLSPARWIAFIREDFEAGATRVITESRESGTSGICRENGELRLGLLEEILESDLPADQLIFEAPKKALQTYFVNLIGTNVNLANVAPADVIGLETLRLGLRSDTFMSFEQRDCK